MKTVPEILRAGAATYAERNTYYKDNYKRIGAQLASMFPAGLPPMDADGWNRFALWLAVYQKTVRYAVSIETGGAGHADSAHDAMVYAAMLEELTPTQTVAATTIQLNTDYNRVENEKK